VAAIQRPVSPYELANDLKELGEKAFRNLYSHGFLLVKRYPVDGEDFMFPKTVLSPVVDLEEVLERGKAEKPDEDDIPLPGTLIALRKTDRNAYTTKITVGRAKNNDIVIRASKVSKLHCAFVPRRSGRYDVVDMGSANGTSVNGERLHQNKAVRLRGRDVVSLHRHEFEFLDTDSLIEMLKVLP
jgi:hypothetical protein